MTTFIRVIDAPVGDKARALLDAVQGVASGRNGMNIFSLEPSSFATVPTSPFSYWVSSGIRAVFQKMPRFEAEDRAVRQGLATADDFRFVRAGWEVRSHSVGSRWFGFAKGGAFSPFYADVFLVMNWRDDGLEAKAWAGSLYNQSHWSRILKNTHLYFRPGLTWPLRTQRGFGIRAMPPGCVFGHKGPAAFVEGESSELLLALLAVTTSSAFRALVELQMAFGSYEVGVIQRTPIPRLASTDIKTLAKLARRAWSLKRSLDTSNETSHAFLFPAVATKIDRSAVEQQLEAIQRQIDEEAFRLYEIGADDRLSIDTPPTMAASEPGAADESGDRGDESSDDDLDVAVGTDQLGAWLVGVSFGRFDPRLVTGERAIPPEPEPFDPLPSRSPGMYPEGEEPGDCPDILVDDEGHTDDLAARALAVGERIKVDAPENLRSWLAKEFFPLHIKMYSKSRRKAPIYWQLATPSASYSVWLYIHAFSKDTLFRVQNDYVAPKLAHEERRLESLISELRDGATAAQRKQLAALEALVEELRAFLDEVKRIAPLWKPNLDDGVVINFAPLWRLVPHNKAWQKELKSTWDALCEGKYDWAHLAMQLWPELVVPKCAKDRSLAIAHGIEDMFWCQRADGKWTTRETPMRSVDELVREHTSPAVKSALKSLLEAPVVSGKSAGRNGGGRRKTATAEEGDT
jgi:hypothetical protein